MFIFSPIHVDDQQNGSPDHSNRMPPLLAGNNAVFAEDRERIVEHARRSFECKAVMLPPV
jgi:hypothetical protein